MKPNYEIQLLPEAPELLESLGDKTREKIKKLRKSGDSISTTKQK
jgi:hypothetical protein